MLVAAAQVMLYYVNITFCFKKGYNLLYYKYLINLDYSLH